MRAFSIVQTRIRVARIFLCNVIVQINVRVSEISMYDSGMVYCLRRISISGEVETFRACDQRELKPT